jgi:catechol 2,3-dioxygenase-like lactoylglutathione lyase family enzyme
MTSITSLTLGASDGAAGDFYRTALGPGTPVRPGAGTPGTGFRGFILGVDIATPAGVDRLHAQALALGADELKAPKKQLWGGYSGVVRGPDGTIVKLAADAKATADDDSAVTRTVLLLGVADVKATQRFYAEPGLTVAKSFGSKYVEFEPQDGAVTLALYKRAALAKDVGVAPEGAGAHGLVIGWDAAAATDPDGFELSPSPVLQP